MKRLGIFVFYNDRGYVDKFKEYVIETIREYLDRLVIVINGTILEEEKAKFERYVNKEDIITRSNIGFDGFAYKEVIMSESMRKEICDYDELLLFNDTFYGPFWGWDEVFQDLENSDWDICGLSRHPGGGLLSDGSPILEHIQSYFILIKKNVLKTDLFYSFWEEMNNPPKNLEQAIKGFEIRFSQYFLNNGFTVGSWLDIHDYLNFVKEGENVYGNHPIEIIEKYRFPILKYKIISSFEFMQESIRKSAIDYLERNSDYDTQMIKNHYLRLKDEDKLKGLTTKEIKSFCSSYSRIWIFGHGKYGKIVFDLLNEINVQVAGFVVTKPEMPDERALNSFSLGKDEGMIVALGYKNRNEVEDDIIKKLGKEAILFFVKI